MKYRRLGKTNLLVSAIGFGAIKLPEVSAEQAKAAINRALDLGVNFIDTARDYADSERKVGAAIKGRRDQCFIATKTLAREAPEATRQLETSLKELDIDKIDLYQLHSVSDEATYRQVMSLGGAFEAVKKAKEEGKIEHIGISIHRDLTVMRQAIKSGQFETIMVSYSPVDQEGVEKEIIPLAREYDLGVIAMKPLLGGQLTSPGSVEGPDPIVRGALRYILSNEAISTVIPGMVSVREVEENCALGDFVGKISQEEKEELLRMIGNLRKQFDYGQVCLRCGYCQPCPEGINIPEVFRAMDVYQNYPDELKHLGLELYRSLEVKPDLCTECRQCEEKCPASLSIPERLKEALELFSEKQL